MKAFDLLIEADEDGGTASPARGAP
jgi:hypothetical protein